MRVSEIGKKFGFESITSAVVDAEFSGGYTSDLLSDVMANAKEGQVLITIQAHKNSIAVATLIGLPAIVICNNRPVPEDMREAAERESVALYKTEKTQFEVSGLLYEAAVSGSV